MQISSYRKSYFFILSVLFLGSIFLGETLFKFNGQELKVNFYDVGQGDAIYIRTPDQQDILIDGGPDSTILNKLGKDMPFYDRKIELVILTHPESDHISGLIDVLNRYEVEQILWTGIKRSLPIYNEWEKILTEKDIAQVIATADKTVILGKTRLEILFPFKSLKGEKCGKEYGKGGCNNKSVVSKLVYGDIDFLFTGDIEKEVENKLIQKVNQSDNFLEAEVLKVAHHGSKSSSQKKFVSLVKPQYAIISVGRKNPYGHPHFSVLNTLSELGIKVFRTDQDGDIQCTSNGENLECHKR